MKRIRVIFRTGTGGQEVLSIAEPLFVGIVADRFVIEDRRGPIKKSAKSRANGDPSAVSRRLSPDMKKRWMPTVNGKIVAGAGLPFDGFATRREAVAAAKQFEATS